MDATGSVRTRRPSLERVDQDLRHASDDAVARVIARIESLFDIRKPFSGRVEVRCGGSAPFVVDGSRKAVEQGGASDAQIEIHTSDIQRLVAGEMDPRQAMLFGQLKIAGGSVRTAIEFGDFLTGRTVVEVMQTSRALPEPTRDFEQARADLREFGYCLVRDALSPDAVAALRARVVEQAAAEIEQVPSLINDSAHRIWNLMNKGAVFHELLDSPVIDELVPEYLGENFLLTSYSANIALPGNTSSFMHYDQIYVQPPINDFAVGLNLLWFLDDVSDANGGTRVMPGSHRTGVAPSDPYAVDNTVAAAGPAGTVLLLDSRVWHSVGHNVTNRKRHVIVSYFNRSYMRTQENYFLSLRPDVQDTLSERLKIMLGFRCTGSLGGVEGPVEGKIVERPAAPFGAMTPATPDLVS